AQGASEHPSRTFWQDNNGTPPAFSSRGARPAMHPHRFRAAALDRQRLAASIAGAPHERSRAAREQPLVISLPDPDGGFQRFTVAVSPVMEPGLAAKHPEIKT